METINSWKLQYAWMLNALKREEGQTFAEYALIFALVVIVAMVALGAIGTNVTAKFQAVADALV